MKKVLLNYFLLLIICTLLVLVLAACGRNQTNGATIMQEKEANIIKNDPQFNRNTEKQCLASSDEVIIINYEDIPEDSDVYIQEGSNWYFDDVRFIDIGEKACVLPEIIRTGTEGDYQYAIHKNGKVQILKYIGNDSEVIIPNNLAGCPVSYIGKLAFAENNPDGDLTVENPKHILISVVMPDTVVGIGDTAFYYCQKLETIRLSNNLKYIGSLAFAYCENLNNLEFTSSLEAIGYNAFKGIGIKRLVVPETIRYIGPGAFSDCYKFNTIEFEGGSVYIDSAPFSYSNIDKLFIPSNTNVEGLGAMFANMENLKIVEYSATMDKDTIVYAEMYRGCSKLQEIKLPSNVTKIEEYAFQGCNKLKQIHIPKSVKSIETWAFTHCNSLKNVYFESPNCEGLEDSGLSWQIRRIYAPSGGNIEEFCNKQPLLKFVATDNQSDQSTKANQGTVRNH